MKFFCPFVNLMPHETTLLQPLLAFVFEYVLFLANILTTTTTTALLSDFVI